MKNIELKNMTTEKRRDYLLHSLQTRAIMVLWSVRDNEEDIMIHIKRYKDMYRIYRNIKIMLGQQIFESPLADLNLLKLNWFLL